MELTLENLIDYCSSFENKVTFVIPNQLKYLFKSKSPSFGVFINRFDCPIQGETALSFSLPNQYFLYGMGFITGKWTPKTTVKIILRRGLLSHRIFNEKMLKFYNLYEGLHIFEHDQILVLKTPFEGLYCVKITHTDE